MKLRVDSPHKIERVGVVFFSFFFVGGVMAFGLFQKQILEHQQFAQASVNQSTSQSTTPAERGRIIASDRNGTLVTLAVSDWRYNLVVSPKLIKDKQKFAQALSGEYPKISAADVLAGVSNDKVFSILAKDLTVDEADKISQQNYRGVTLMPGLTRVYPDGSNIAPQVLGFVGVDGVGKYGIEASYENQLEGKKGDQKSQRDSLGRLIDVLSTDQSQPGSDLILSLDYNLQYEVENQLKAAIQNYKADSGAIVVMNPKTGAILAMAGQPNFDPNNYRTVPGDQAFTFQAPAISDVYEPGSVFKALTMSMGIELGLITPDTVYTPGSSVTVNGHQIFNALNKNFGTETASQALQNSDNVWLTHLSSLIGADKERTFLDKYGVGKKTGVDIAGEESGRLPPATEWNDLLRSTAAFGQGVSTTLLQLTADYAVIANGGKTVTPYVVDKIVVGNQATKPAPPAGGLPSGVQVISPDTANKVRDMLVTVVTLGEGHHAAVAGMSVAGKTGTAQVPDGHGGYSTTAGIGTFVGFFPANDPKFVMAVRLNNPKTVKFAESSAAPTFGVIADWIANYYGLR